VQDGTLHALIIVHGYLVLLPSTMDIYTNTSAPSPTAESPFSGNGAQMDILGFLAELYSERDRIDSAITALEALNGNAITPAKTAIKPHAVKSAKAFPVSATATKRVVSPESRKKMANAQQKRWAKKKRAVKAAAKKAAPVTTEAAKEPAKA
jgi:hypothetical protein